MDCRRCNDLVSGKHGTTVCRFSGCEVVAEDQPEPYCCPRTLTLDSREAKQEAFGVMAVAHRRGVLEDLLATYPEEQAARLGAWFEWCKLELCAMAVVDGREEGAGVGA